jgi:hypothetical protein
MASDRQTGVGADLRRALSWPVASRSLRVAVVVGTILNLINQGDALVGEGEVDWLKVVLTYCVPFVVASYGAYGAIRSMSRGRSARRET